MYTSNQCHAVTLIDTCKVYALGDADADVAERLRPLTFQSVCTSAPICRKGVSSGAVLSPLTVCTLVMVTTSAYVLGGVSAHKHSAPPHPAERRCRRCRRCRRRCRCLQTHTA